MSQSMKTSKRAPCSHIAQICARWGQKHCIKYHNNLKSGKHNATKIKISTTNLTISKGAYVMQAIKTYRHDEYFIFVHFDPGL